MKILSIFFTTFLFIKSFAYSMFELNKQENKSGGTFILILSIFAFIFSFVSICLY